jgi:hypothetical protein
VVVTTPQPLAGAIVYVTVYVPGVLETGVTVPLDASIVSPIVEENIPPIFPVKVTVPGRAELQKGLPEYKIEAVGNVFMVTEVEAVTRPQPAEGDIV